VCPGVLPLRARERRLGGEDRVLGRFDVDPGRVGEVQLDRVATGQRLRSECAAQA
jgi:hypothetical protein